MRILIIGGDGMLGHRLFLDLAKNHVVKATLRQSVDAYQLFNIFNDHNSYFNVDLLSDEVLSHIFGEFQPEIVLNAAGIVKQRAAAKEAIASIAINSLFPHRLASICQNFNARLISFSTDCVFSGNRGYYAENDIPDPLDLYGRSKLLGEIVGIENCLTLRAPFYGLELANKKGLIEWFLAQRGEIKGFSKAIYSGMTTMEMSRLIDFIITKRPQLYGLWHVASQPISKYDWLMLLAKKLNHSDITILRDDDFLCDRSLNGERFVAETNYSIPSWDTMLDALVSQINFRYESGQYV